MNFKNLLSFIKYGTDEKITSDKMMLGAVGVLILSLLGGLFGFFRGTFTFCLSIVIYILSILYIIVISVISRNLTFKKRVLFFAINSAFVIVIFSLICYSFLYMADFPYKLIISVSPLLFGVLSLLFCYITIKNNGYIGKKNNPKYYNLLAYAAIGAGLGSLLLNDVSIETFSDEVVIAFLLCTVAILFAIMGAPTILKLHYIKKLELQGYSFRFIY